jgi:hypothetical protein
MVVPKTVKLTICQAFPRKEDKVINITNAATLKSAAIPWLIAFAISSPLENV